ncbi:hypothetical protein HOLleu_11989 [Holothuria leucospilota]|uniref:Uncharacterized protein n=1 Tax=Holothuria leucospilota TaxID=206669 RepID=A0A9Q1HDI8_HOLLE|nr:hypothetical protein HOLleu_11989 [Holothuria leucospilota]
MPHSTTQLPAVGETYEICKHLGDSVTGSLGPVHHPLRLQDRIHKKPSIIRAVQINTGPSIQRTADGLRERNIRPTRERGRVYCRQELSSQASLLILLSNAKETGHLASHNQLEAPQQILHPPEKVQNGNSRRHPPVPSATLMGNFDRPKGRIPAHPDPPLTSQVSRLQIQRGRLLFPSITIRPVDGSKSFHPVHKNNSGFPLKKRCPRLRLPRRLAPNRTYIQRDFPCDRLHPLSFKTPGMDNQRTKVLPHSKPESNIPRGNSGFPIRNRHSNPREDPDTHRSINSDTLSPPSPGQTLAPASNLHINLLEMEAILLAVNHWKHLLSGHQLTTLCDNLTMVSYINRRGNEVSVSMLQNMATTSSPQYPHQSNTPSGTTERHGRRLIQGNPSRDGVVSIPNLGQPHLPDLWTAVSRPLCDSEQCQITDFLHKVIQPPGMGDRCATHTVGQPLCVRLPPVVPHPASASQTRRIQSGPPSSRTVLAQSTLVSSPLGNADRPSIQVPSQRQSTHTERRKDMASMPPPSTSGNVGTSVRHFTSQGLSREAATIASESRRPSTMKQVSTIRNYRSAISSIHKGFPDGSNIGSNKTIGHLLKGMFNKRPPQEHLSPSWSINEVLAVLAKPPYEPIHNTSLELLTYKTLFLVAAASARCRSELHALTTMRGFLHFSLNRSPYNPASKDTLSRWIVNLISPHASADETIQAHHLRAHASSKAWFDGASRTSDAYHPSAGVNGVVSNDSSSTSDTLVHLTMTTFADYDILRDFSICEPSSNSLLQRTWREDMFDLPISEELEVSASETEDEDN